MKVSVIIPAFNAQATIKNVLDAIFQQDYKDSYEVIVVDDGSTDQTAQIIKSFNRVNYFFQKNAGPASARNLGAKNAQGQILVFTDSDCVPHKDWISQLILGFDKNNSTVVMGSYGIANPQHALSMCVHDEIIFRHHKLLPDNPKVFGSYNFAIQKYVFNKVGGFSLNFRNASGEDNDLSYRIINKGYSIYFQRKALVNHYHPTQIGKYLKEQFRHGYWRVSMYFSHPSMVKGDGYTFWKDIIELPLCLFLILGLVLIMFKSLGLTIWLLFLVAPFLLMEIYFSKLMIKDKRNIFFWGIIMFFRSFSRFFGLSTGFFSFFCKKILNKT